MRIQKKNHELIRQNERNVKKSLKHDANLQKSSILYFQVGLIVVLLVTYGLFEMKFETKHYPKSSLKPVDDVLYVDILDAKKVMPESKTVAVKKQQRKLTTKLKIVPDITSFDISKTDILDDTPTSVDLFNPDNLKLVEKPEEDDKPYDFVEQVPVYPGCEKAKDNNERKACMSDKINKLVQKKFNGDIASRYGLTGIQKIFVNFKIDKTGHITDINTRAPHPKLQEETERVIKKIPKMLPGKQQDKPVGVIYSLPIIFKVQN